MRRMPRYVLILAILLQIVVFSGCKKVDSSHKVSLATGKNIWCTLVLVAKEKGFFKEEGLDVTLNYQDAGRYCMDALLSKSVDFAAVVEANVGYVGFTGNRSPVVLAEIVASSSGIVARKSKGIKKPTDLRGKRIAYVPATGAEPFLYRFLQKHGILLKDVELRKMQPKAIQPALVAGEIDAAATWEPFIYNCIKAMGGDAIEFRDSDAFTGYMMIAARRDWATENKTVVNSMLRSLSKAEVYVASHPAEAQAFLAKTTEMDSQTVEKIWPYFDIKIRMDKQALLQAIRYVGENARSTNQDFKDKPLPEYNDYIDESYLANMKQ